MIVTTGNDIAGYEVTEYLGIVRRINVRSTVGGSIREYARVCERARNDVYDTMIQHAEALGAHAILAMRYDATEFMQGSTDIFAYGTAVKIRPSEMD